MNDAEYRRRCLVLVVIVVMMMMLIVMLVVMMIVVVINITIFMMMVIIVITISATTVVSLLRFSPVGGWMARRLAQWHLFFYLLLWASNISTRSLFSWSFPEACTFLQNWRTNPSAWRIEGNSKRMFWTWMAGLPDLKRIQNRRFTPMFPGYNLY